MLFWARRKELNGGWKGNRWQKRVFAPGDEAKSQGGTLCRTRKDFHHMGRGKKRPRGEGKKTPEAKNQGFLGEEDGQPVNPLPRLMGEALRGKALSVNPK